jgi:hypothetical protein
MNNAAIALRRALSHVVSAVNQQDMQLALGQLPGNARANAACAHDNDIPHSIGGRLGAGGEALAARKSGLFDGFWSAVGFEQGVTRLDVRPNTGDISERV